MAKNVISPQAQSGPVEEEHVSTPSTLPILAVANADFVTPQLAVGGDLDVYDDDRAVDQALDLIGVGITHVLDVRQECDDADFWAGSEVAYLWNGIDDAGQRVPAAWFEEVVTWALDALADPGHRLLVHCHMGINRGPSAGYAVLLAQGWDPVEAIAAIRSARPVANVWYAEDALSWWHERNETDASTRHRERRRMDRWRGEHPLDVVRIIAAQRERGQ